MSNNNKIVEKIAGDFGISTNDTGCAVSQIAILSDRISRLSDHMSKNKQDRHTLRGLSMLVARRKKLLSYLNKTDAPTL
jgi:small subunit ribosomal protein S15